MKNLHYTFIAFFFFLNVFGQQDKIDSLKTAYKNETIDTLKVKILKSICNTYYYTNYTEGLAYVDTLMQFSKKIKKFDNVSFGHRYIGGGFIQKGKFKEAILEFKKSIVLMDSLGQHNNKYSDFMNIGSAYRYARKFDDASKYYNKAIEIAERLGKKGRFIVINNNLGAMAYEQEKYDEATSYLMKSLEYKEYNKNPRRLVTTYDNLGLVHYEINQYKKAVEYFKEALVISEKTEYAAGIADSKKNIAKCYTAEKKNIDEGILYLKDAIEIYKNINDNMFLIEAYSNLGDTYEIANDFSNAINFHKKAVALAEEVGMEDKVLGSRISLSRTLVKQGKLTNAEKELQHILKDIANENLLERQLVIAYETKAELSRLKKDYKNAFLYQKKFSDLENSIQQNERVKDINEIETKYQTEKKEKENLQLKADNVEQELLTQKANTRNWFLLFCSLGLGISGFFIYRRYKAETKAKEIISKQKETIENLQKELHHRIKNNLSIIDTFIEVAKEEFSDSKFQTKLTELQNRIDSINEVHLQLYQNNDVTNLNLKKYIDTLAQNINASFSDSNINLKTSIDDDLNINTDKSFSVGLIVNEFLTNSYKYAFDNSDGEIQIGMKENKQHYELSLSDNGKGLPKDFDIKKTDSFGLRIMKLLTEQLNGTFNLSNNKGVALRITFPKT